MASTGIQFDPINQAVDFLYNTLDDSLNVHSSKSNLPLKSLEEISDEYTKEDRFEDSREALADLFFCQEIFEIPEWQSAIDLLSNDSAYPASLIAKDLSALYRDGQNPLELVSRADHSEDLEDPDGLDEISQPMHDLKKEQPDYLDRLHTLENLDLPKDTEDQHMEYLDSSQFFADLLVLIDKSIHLEKEIEKKETEREFDEFMEPCKVFAKELTEKLSNRFVDILVKLREALKQGTDIWDPVYQQLQDLLMAPFPAIVKDVIFKGENIVALIKSKLEA